MKLDNNAFLTAATEATVVLECDVINNNHNNHNRVFTLYLCVCDSTVAKAERGLNKG